MKKIMFTDPLTRAVIAEKKTKTRREESGLSILRNAPADMISFGPYQSFVHTISAVEHFDDIAIPIGAIKPHFQIGEVVAVAQRYSSILEELENPENFSCMEHWESANEARAHYASFLEHPGWDNKMFVLAEEMPHRILIKDVHIELLQDISEEDCLKEGIEEYASCCECGGDLYSFEGADEVWPNPRKAFAFLIDQTCGKGTWKRNPFNVVYDFELVK